MSQLKVLISGGGVAGPAMAYWLGQTGANVTLVERSSNKRLSGQQVDLRAQGIEMMRKMGIEKPIRAAVVHEKGMKFVNRAGQTKAVFPAVRSGTGKQSFTSEIEIMRGDLVQILFAMSEALPNVAHRFNSTVTNMMQDPESQADGKVHVTFDDGHSEDYDLVVGADGSGSKTRKIMLGPDAPDPRHPLSGYIAFFSVPSQEGDPDWATFCHLPKSRVSRIIGTRKDCPELTRVYLMTNGNDETLNAAYKAGDKQKLKQVWADLYTDGGWQSNRFMEALRTCPEADDLYSTPFEQVRLPPGDWSRGRIALIGDAAHSGTANGLGCTWGLIGAYVLAGEIVTRLSHGNTPTEAVVQGAKEYETIFRPIATANHEDGRFFESLFYPKTSVGIWFLHSFAKALSHLPLDKMPNIDGKTEKWALPDYPELEKHTSEVKVEPAAKAEA